jgi:hypothetical protein
MRRDRRAGGLNVILRSGRGAEGLLADWIAAIGDNGLLPEHAPRYRSVSIPVKAFLSGAVRAGGLKRTFVVLGQPGSCPFDLNTAPAAGVVRNWMSAFAAAAFFEAALTPPWNTV